MPSVETHVVLSTLSLDGCPLRPNMFMAMLDAGGMQLHSHLDPGASEKSCL